MALRVLGQVDNQSNHCGWQLLSANAAWLYKRRRIKGPNYLLGFVQSLVHFIEQLVERVGSSWRWIHLVVDCLQLFTRELVATQVGGQTLDAARDMTQMKSHWREVVWVQPDFGIG